MKAVLNNLTKIKDVGKTALTRVTFDNNESAYCFQDYTEVLSLIGKEVLYDTRDELVEGKIEKVITELTAITKIVALDREENFKLYCDTPPLCESNIIFNDITDEGVTIEDAIVFVVNIAYESSNKASWCKLTIMDKKRCTAALRVFDPEERLYSLKNKYVQTTIRKTKFGFNASEVYPLGIKPAELNPEIKLAEQFIISTIKSDSKLTELVDSTDLINKMKNYDANDGMEIGYELVRCAIELALARDFINLTRNVDAKILMRLVIYSRLFLWLDIDTLSIEAKTLLALAQIKCQNKKIIMAILDPTSEIKTAEGELYRMIKEIAKFTVNLNSVTSLVSLNDKIWGNK